MPIREAADPAYERSWRDLRRRELLFWLVVLSYLPGVLLTILAVSLFRYDVPDQFAFWVGGGWIASYLALAFYRRGFRCPRCHDFFLRRGRNQTSSSHTCAHCELPCWAPEDPGVHGLLR